MRESMAKRIRDLRVSRGESQQELAAAVLVTDAAISAYENGDRVPRDEVKVRISEHFGVPVQDIFLRKNDTKRVVAKEEMR